MGTKKKLIEESFNKIKNLVESKINEQPVTQSQPASNPQRDQKISQNIDVTMDQAMQVVVGKLPGILANFSKSFGDKDGAIDIPGVYDSNAQQTTKSVIAPGQTIQEDSTKEITFDEGKFAECVGGELNEAGVIGLVASAPAILKYGGQATKWIGKKMDSRWLQKWGNKTAEAGEKLHHKYIHIIEKALKPLMPSATPEQLHKAANGVFLGAVGILFAGSLAHPGMLTGVKGAELGQEALSALQKSLPTLGFA